MTITRGQVRVYYKAEHRDPHGNLISRCADIQAPDPPTCLKLDCLFRYFRECLYAALLTSYHARRVAYAERNKNKKILERYRTGELSPKNIWQAIHANIKLRCPVCRKYNVDPFLFDVNYRR